MQRRLRSHPPGRSVSRSICCLQAERAAQRGACVDLARSLADPRRMFGLGIPELLIILVIVVVLFGATRLPQIGEGLGKGIRAFRSGIKDPPEIDVTPDKNAGSETSSGDRENG